MPAACPERNETFHSPEPERFGEILRNYRRAAGLTQEELAERAGISPRSISGLERGEGATPRRDTVAQLVQALGLVGTELAEFKALVVRRRPMEPRLVVAQPKAAAIDLTSFLSTTCRARSTASLAASRKCASSARS